MNNADVMCARLAAGQNGMLTMDQLDALGLTRFAVERRVRVGLLIPEHRGVYRHAAFPPTPTGRVHAAVLAAGNGAVASHRSAARLHTFRDVPRWRPEITVQARDLPIRAGAHIHRTDRLEPEDVTVISDVPATTAARTLLDLGAVVPYEIVEQAAHDAIIRNLTSFEAVVSVLERVGGRGRRGTAALRAVVRDAVPDERLESLLELKLLQLLPADDPPVLQYELTCVDGRRVRLDAAWPGRRIAIEANGRRWHATARDFRRDMERRRSIEASNWAHYEYGWADVTEQPWTVRHESAQILAATPRSLSTSLR